MVLVAVVGSAAGCLYLGVLAAALLACACMGIPLACVSWFPCFFVWRFAFGGSLLLDAFTHLVSRRPRPMRAGDVSGRALLLVVVWPLCPFPRALRTSAPFRRVAAWRIVQHTCFGGRHVPVAPTLCCLVVLFYLLVLGRAQVPYSYCMHFSFSVLAALVFVVFL